MQQLLEHSPFATLGKRVCADRGKQSARYMRAYCLHRCGLCGETVAVATGCGDWERGVRFTIHLQACAGNHKKTPPSANASRERNRPTLSTKPLTPLTRCWSVQPGPAPWPAVVEREASALGGKKKRRRKLPPAQSRARREQRERTKIHKWIDAYPHKID